MIRDHVMVLNEDCPIFDIPKCRLNVQRVEVDQLDEMKDSNWAKWERWEFDCNSLDEFEKRERRPMECQRPMERLMEELKQHENNPCKDELRDNTTVELVPIGFCRQPEECQGQEEDNAGRKEIIYRAEGNVPWDTFWAVVKTFDKCCTLYYQVRKRLDSG